jgi:hypothetical protein
MRTILLTMFYWLVCVSFTKWYRRRGVHPVKPVSLAHTA